MHKKILVLGSTGMLGSMAHLYLSNSSPYQITGATRNKNPKDKKTEYFEVQNFFRRPKIYSYLHNFDYIINCIGIIKPHCKDSDPDGIKNAITVNALFPYKLSKFCQKSSVKILQIATDCVYSGKIGQYVEDASHDALDVYGKTKSLGEVQADNVLHIRCSIIGPELKTSFSLLEWFLHQKAGVKLDGYTHHRWNGVTTLQFAKLCKVIIDTDAFDSLKKINHLHHFVPNNTVTKYELLMLMKHIFQKKVSITPVEVGVAIDRTLMTQYGSLSSLYPKESIPAALRDLKEYINKSGSSYQYEKKKPI